MAYTFEELAAFFPAGPFPSANITQVITQQDGRTSYGEGVLNGYDQGTATFSGEGTQIFNDRVNPLGPGTWDDQSFDVRRKDLVDMKLQRISTNNYRVEYTLKSWGNAIVRLNLTRPNLQAKVMIGWGATIGHGEGQALYAISINSAAHSPG